MKRTSNCDGVVLEIYLDHKFQKELQQQIFGENYKTIFFKQKI